MSADHNGDSQFTYIHTTYTDKGVGSKEEGVETGYRIDGSLFSPGSRNNSNSVKKQFRIKGVFKRNLQNSGGPLAVRP